MADKVYKSGNPRKVYLKGRLSLYYNSKLQTWIARSAPSGNGGPTPKRVRTQQALILANKSVAQASAADHAAAIEYSAGLPFNPKDLLMMGVMGTLVTFTTRSGQTYVSERLSQTSIEQLLDSITSTPGALLVRSADMWVYLPPGAGDQSLQIDPDTGYPYWNDQAGGSGGAYPMMGTTQLQTYNSLGGNYISVVPLIAPAGAAIDKIGIMGGDDLPSASWAVGIYDDNAYSPNNLLGQSAAQTGITKGSPAIAALSTTVNVVRGDLYWLAWWCDTAFHTWGGTQNVRGYLAHSSSTFPDPISGVSLVLTGAGLFATLG